MIAAGSWRRLPHQGVVNYTPFVILVRPGNPLGIHDFADAARRMPDQRAPPKPVAASAAWLGSALDALAKLKHVFRGRFVIGDTTRAQDQSSAIDLPPPRSG